MEQKKDTHQNTVLRLVGPSGLPFSTVVVTADKKSKQLKVSTRNSVDWSVATREWLVERHLMMLSRKCLQPKKGSFPKTTGSQESYIQCGIQIEQTTGKDLVKRMTIGVLLLSKGINGFVRYVEIKGRVARSFVLTILNHFLSILNYDLKLVTGVSFVSPVM